MLWSGMGGDLLSVDGDSLHDCSEITVIQARSSKRVQFQQPKTILGLITSTIASPSIANRFAGFMSTTQRDTVNLASSVHKRASSRPEYVLLPQLSIGASKPISGLV